jgi:hypothetical protein
VNGTIGTPANLLHDDILIDAVICPPVGFVIGELNTSIQGFLVPENNESGYWATGQAAARNIP